MFLYCGNGYISRPASTPVENTEVHRVRDHGIDTGLRAGIFTINFSLFAADKMCRVHPVQCRESTMHCAEITLCNERASHAVPGAAMSRVHMLISERTVCNVHYVGHPLHGVLIFPHGLAQPLVPKFQCTLCAWYTVPWANCTVHCAQRTLCADGTLQI